MKSYSPYQFAIFRIILGFYLLIHFVFLISYAAEIWSSSGMLPDATTNLTHGIFPNILNYVSSSLGVTIYVALLTILSLCLLLGFQRPLISILLWYGWASLFDRNNLINNPGIPYVGWLLLCCAIIPKGEPLSITKSKSDESWSMPIIIFLGAWALMALGYTISGFDKFNSPSWRNGTAIFHLLENPLARDWWLRDLIVQLPIGIIKIKTWAVLFIEMAFLPFCFFKFTRKCIWFAMIGMHLGILLIVDFADLTLGILMIHWFTFDATWFKPNPKQTGLLYFDGVCGLCNNFINFLMTADHADTLQYAPLQGQTAKENLNPQYLDSLSTIVYQENGETFTESDAVIRAISGMGGLWKGIVFFKIIPKFIRNFVYKIVATNRLKWFGKRDICRMPTPEERNKILL